MTVPARLSPIPSAAPEIGPPPDGGRAFPQGSVMKKILLTGVTGFLGQELLRLLCAEGEEVTCLVRPGKTADARERVTNALTGSSLDPGRVAVVEGDLALPRFGLDAAGWDRLTAETTTIIHCAADVRFNRPLEKIRRINVEGVGHVLDLAAACRQSNPDFERLDYVSTAYVAGRRTGVATEDELEHSAGFKNTYEQTKHEAEKLVRQRRGELPVAIYRPSIVLGASGNGVAKPNNVIYPMLKVFSRWRLAAAPANAATRLDLVPVDYVARSLIAISKTPAAVGGCFHLAAGEGRDLSLGRFIRIMGEVFHRRIIILPPWVHRKIIRPLLKTFRREFYERSTTTFRAFEPYIFDENPRFSTVNARAALAGTGIEMPDTETFLRACLTYAVNTRFGKAPPTSP